MRIDRRAVFVAGLGFGLAPRTRGAKAQEPASESLAPAGERSGRLTAAVRVNGQGPFAFVVDTGANRTVIAEDLAARLSLAAGPPTIVHGIASAAPAATVRIDQIAIGSLKNRLLAAPVLPRAALGADGLLGVDLLRNRQLVFDFARGAARLAVSSPDRPSLWSRDVSGRSDIVVEAVQRFGQLTLVDAEVGHAVMRCFIDSGAERTVGNLALRRAATRGLDGAGKTPEAVTIVGATGQMVTGEIAEVSDMRIGGVGFTRFAMAFADLHTFALWGIRDAPAILIGMDLLRVFDLVALDFGAGLVRFRLAAGARRP